ncbi:MAG: hypothetical protein ACM3NI_04335 [Bacteroidota bacterium]
MSDPLASADLPRHASGAIAHAGSWIACGWRLIREHKAPWFRMTALYLVLAFLLKHIPFMGDLLLILITPMLLASVVWGRAHAHRADELPAAGGAPSWSEAWLMRPARELSLIFSRPDKAFPGVLLGIITLVLAMLVKFAGDLLIGGSMVSGLTAARLDVLQITTVLGMLVVASLYLILAMGLFYSVPLTVLANRQPLAAISESFALCRRHALALAALAAPFFVVYLLIVTGFTISHAWGYLLIATAGWLALPVFVASVYCSYLSLHPPHHSTAHP